MIEALHLFKRYGSKLAVNDLSLRLDAGTVLGFIGPNGAGKTTTMKMLSGILPPYCGKVLVDGIDLSERPLSAKSKIGFLPENAPLHGSMSVDSFLRYVAEMRGIPHSVLEKKVCLAEERCALTNVLNEEIDSLSKGYKRRVCLAQSIVHEPEILIMDEPTDGLDPNQKIQIRSLIRELRKTSAIIISTHILEEVEAVCTDVLLICNGRKLFDGSRETFQHMALDHGKTLVELFAEMTKKEGAGEK